MAENGDLVLEHLKKIQAQLSASRDRDGELMARMGNLETMMARLVRDNATVYAELVDDRHCVDGLRTRIERIERRLEFDV